MKSKKYSNRGAGRRKGFFGDGGQTSGYADFRYGENRGGKLGGARPVYIPGKGKPTPVVNADQHRHLVDQTAEILGEWKSTKFENEGACRAGLRSAWCLSGHDWHIADATAERIVAEALNKIGARRPSWEEGQWVYTVSPDYCAWCHRPMDGEEQSSGRRFCSVDCAKSAVLHMNRKTNHHYGAVIRSAQRLIDKDKAEPRPCKFCGTMFKADYAAAQFCSVRCNGLHTAGDLAFSHIDRECEECNRTFKPTSRTQTCCSQTCAGVKNRKREAESLAHERRTCTHCQTEYTPTKNTQTYCGKECQTLANRVKHGPVWAERSRAKRAANRPPRPCEWCGEVFTPQTTAGRFCSSRCSGDSSRHSKGWEPRDLTRRVFDRYFTVPFNEAWKEAA